jgi:hypothetical protein
MFGLPGIGYNQNMARERSRDESSRGRAHRRAEWRVRSFRLGEEPGDDLSETTSVEERLSMMWPLAVEAWTVSGRSIPVYDRTSLPGRLFRSGENPPEDSASS